MLQLALIFGGRSAEHEISLASARFVAAMLDREKCDVIPVGIARDGRWLQPTDLEAALRDGLDATPAPAVHLVVVNIDNGIGAGATAALIARRAAS